jgi:hypothetical protein
MILFSNFSAEDAGRVSQADSGDSGLITLQTAGLVLEGMPKSSYNTK